MRARMEPGFPEAVLAAISQSTNELTQGWMRLLASAPPPVDASWFGANSALQASYRAQGMEPDSDSSPDKFQRIIDATTASLAPVIRSIG